MIGQKKQDALNATVTAELYSVNRYLAMAAWCDGKSYKGFGRWLKVQYFAVLDHERHVTQSIDELHRAAVAEKDTAAHVFSQWFVAEQVEEEATVQEIVDKLRMIGDKSSAALYLDKEYGKRVRATAR